MSTLYEIWEQEDYIKMLTKDWSATIDDFHRRDIYKMLRKNHKKGMTVLDAGCGVGIDSPAIMKIFGNYLGVDKSNNMIKTAKERNPDYNFVVGDVTELHFEDNEFDIVVSNDVIRHQPDYGIISIALNDLIRVSKNVAIIALMLTEGKTYVNKDMNYSLRKKCLHTDWIINIDEFCNMLIASGCADYKIHWSKTNAPPPLKKAIIEVFK